MCEGAYKKLYRAETAPEVLKFLDPLVDLLLNLFQKTDLAHSIN